ncbi:hypothetical protein P5G63_13240 [Aeromonas salmonicida]|uniref:hypothetical protein n=1 Tax=Aeromonas salmonicida TaxID=645 RepID=UPI002240B897|nr:hypothetical protein [Aeromonas salmonicida]MDF8329405.1 hypothetical protein [Aeromonas salmonicida]
MTRKNTPKTPTIAAKQTAVIGKKLIDLTQIAWTKRYQPLNEPLESLTSEASARMGVGINAVERQLAFEAMVEPEDQVQFLNALRNALADAGLLERYFLMPDGTFLLPELVVSADYGEVANGSVVRLYGPSGDKPLITCLCSSEAECEQTLQALSARLNGSSAK